MHSIDNAPMSNNNSHIRENNIESPIENNNDILEPKTNDNHE